MIPSRVKRCARVRGGGSDETRQPLPTPQWGDSLGWGLQAPPSPATGTTKKKERGEQGAQASPPRAGGSLPSPSALASGWGQDAGPESSTMGPSTPAPDSQRGQCLPRRPLSEGFATSLPGSSKSRWEGVP